MCPSGNEEFHAVGRETERIHKSGEEEMVPRYAEGIKNVPGLDVEAAVAKIERMVEERVREGQQERIRLFLASTVSSTTSREVFLRRSGTLWLGSGRRPEGVEPDVLQICWQEKQRRRQGRMGDGKFEKGNSGKGREMRRRVGFGGDQSDRKHTEETKRGDNDLNGTVGSGQRKRYGDKGGEQGKGRNRESRTER